MPHLVSLAEAVVTAPVGVVSRMLQGQCSGRYASCLRSLEPSFSKKGACLGANRRLTSSVAAAAGMHSGPPSQREYDAAVLGLGAFGSAAAYHLASRGVSVQPCLPRPGLLDTRVLHGASKTESLTLQDRGQGAGHSCSRCPWAQKQQQSAASAPQALVACPIPAMRAHYDTDTCPGTVLQAWLHKYFLPCLYDVTQARVLGIERQPHVGHSMGSSHGHTRIIRLAYAEGQNSGRSLRSHCFAPGRQRQTKAEHNRLLRGFILVWHLSRLLLLTGIGNSNGTCATSHTSPAGPEYVPLLKRSYRLFAQLEAESGQTLFYKTGMLDIGPGPVFQVEHTPEASLLLHLVLCWL
jgi:hypothetical protein